MCCLWLRARSANYWTAPAASPLAGIAQFCQPPAARPAIQQLALQLVAAFACSAEIGQTAEAAVQVALADLTCQSWTQA